MKIIINGTEIDADPVATRQIYLQISDANRKKCDCDDCTLFFALGRNAFGEEFLALLDTLGIDYKWDTEIYYSGKIDNNVHLYCGWYHFVGRIITDNNDKRDPDKSIHYYVMDKQDLLENEFKTNNNVLQLEFELKIPETRGITTC
jgi:hypothetical protein